ncbi:MAG: hypothetical protein IJX78_00100 [Bacilli bacterium]|nr:hypothetical protein [Bacilli bacterium]
MKKINEFDKNIIRYSLFVALGIAILVVILCIIFHWPITYVIGFILSYIVNVIVFLKSNYYIDKILSREKENPKKSMIINNLTNNLLQTGILLLNLLLDCFNVFVGLVGLLIIKIVVIFGYGFKKKE